MKTINAAVRSNSGLAYALDDRRDNGVNTATVKRQSRRQVRHRLDTELRMQMDQHLAEAKEMISYQHRTDAPKPATHASATIIAFPRHEARPGRVVKVTRKLAGQPFARKQVQVVLLAA
jgi:hypothetical protein